MMERGLFVTGITLLLLLLLLLLFDWEPCDRLRIDAAADIIDAAADIIDATGDADCDNVMKSANAMSKQNILPSLLCVCVEKEMDRS